MNIVLKVNMFFTRYFKMWLLVFCIYHVNGLSTTTGGPRTTDMAPPNYYDDYMFMMLGYTSDLCTDRRTCCNGLTYPDRNCFCDKLCGVMGDCCGNVDKSELYDVASVPNATQFKCLRVPGLVKNVNSYGSLLVAQCAASWSDEDTRSFCESSQTLFDENVLVRMPVSDTINDEVMYKNMYCAYCNYVYDIQFWSPKYECVNETDPRYIPGSSECKLSFITPGAKYKRRNCPLKELISTCPSGADEELARKCREEHYYIVFSELDDIFRNEYCAQCNYLDRRSIYCEGIALSSPAPSPDPRTYSFRLLVDFNTRSISKNDRFDYAFRGRCRDDQIYDVMYDICRDILCVSPAVASGGRCVYQTLAKGPSQDALDNCTWSKLNPDEYRVQNDSSLFILSEEKIIQKNEYRKNGTDVFICSDKHNGCSEDCDKPGVKFNFDVTEAYVSMIGLIISIVALTITLMIYAYFPQLRNTPGKILICLIVALLLAQVLFLVSAEASNIPWLCKAFGILIHYFYLAAFCWMNVIAFDLWMTFSNKFVTSGSSTKTAKRLRFYTLYAWLVPLIIVCVAVVLDHVEFEQHAFLKPGYGASVCWISSKYGLLLFFVGPLALFKLFDIVSFIFTAVHIARAKRQGAMARQKKNTCSLLINIKLSLVMGLTWVFAFIASLTNETVMWYLFIIFNTLQGLFIAISFLCTKKVGRLLHEKYEVVSSVLTKSTTSTQLTTYSKSGESGQ